MANFKWTREKVLEVKHIRHWNLQLKPAVEKMRRIRKEAEVINNAKPKGQQKPSTKLPGWSDHVCEKLLEPGRKFERERIPSLPDKWWDLL